MNEERIEELKNALRAIMQMIASRNAPLSQELRQLLSQVVAHVGERIQALRSESEAGELPATPQSPPTQPSLQNHGPSSNINSFGYDEDSGRLLVKFQGDHPQENGPVYAYQGVPKQIFDLFRKGAVPARTDGQNAWGQWWKGKVPSLGASMFTLIKGGNYPYQRIG